MRENYELECTGCHAMVKAEEAHWWDGDFLQVSNTMPEPGEEHPYCAECNAKIERIVVYDENDEECGCKECGCKECSCCED